MGVVKVRLWGLPDDVEAFAAVVRAVLPVLEESPDYQNNKRGQKSAYVRRYLEIRALADDDKGAV